MRKVYPLLLFLLFFLFLFNVRSSAQASACPSVTTGTVAPVCSGQCVNLSATVQGTLQTNTYTVSTIPYSPYPYNSGTAVLVNIDDVWTPVINLPFCFQFFGNTYSQIVIGSNGLISFDVTQANAYCQWPIGAAIPSTSDPMNSIMCPWHDIDPSVGSTSDTRYATYGTAPCREFVISWYHIPMFSSSCNASLATQQIVLHENTNIIDMYIESKPLCSSWNGGYAIEGIQNSTGTVAFAVPGRNYPTQWTATNDGKRFMPAGAPNYSLQWTGPSGVIGTTTTVNVCPTTTTTYTCTVTNTTCAGNIVVSATETVTVSSTFTITPTQSNVTCNGSCNGSATASVSPAGAYTYSWSPAPGGGQGTANATGLCAGTYTCTVSNPSCTSTITYNITQPPAITATQSQTNVTCNGACDGTASVVASGGTGTYTYAWAPSGGTGATASGLCAGSYTCTISSPAGCSITKTFTITQPPAITYTQSQVNVTCNGSCTGSASVVASGGTGTYTYAWSPSGGTGATASSLCAGSYTCVITSGPSTCTTSAVFTITQPPAITATQSQVNVTCNGSCNGSATVVASGGTGTYTYAWAPSGGTGATASGLCAGTYTCTISSPAGCSITKTFTITQPPAITFTQSQTNVTCNAACNGTASVVASGGTGTYTYAWSPSGGTGATASSLCAGTYTCVITSGPATCTTSAVFTITQPPAVTFTQSQVNVTCNGSCTGSASVVASGGTGTYTYAWSPSGGTGATASSLCAGSYSCVITSGPATCTTTATFNITQPPAITATQSQVNVTCNGGCNGSASVVASGGTGTYTYAWAPSGGTGATATGLCAGTYTCTISSPAGCSITKTFTITQPPALTASSTSTPATCGGNNGTATATPSGGTPGYTYVWAPAPGGGQGTGNATGLVAGSYTCTITDANGCSTTTVATVSTTGGITASITATSNVTCFGGNNGSATATPVGGSSPYTYSWTPLGGTGATGTNLTAGSYTVTVTDANGCLATASTTITQPPQITATQSQTNVTCNAACNGSATVVASGGTGTYTYAWSPSGGTGATASSLCAGTYTCTISSPAGCSITQSFTITQPTPITGTVSSTPPSCNGGTNGSATVTPGGGTPGYTYSWAPSGGTGSTATNLSAGNYSVTITDANSCTLTVTVAVTQPTAVTATTSFTQSTCGNANGSASVVASGGTGAYTYVWSPAPGGGQGTANATGLTAGPYSCTITDANGCTFTATVNVPNAGSPTATITSTTNVSCFGGNNGVIIVTAAGGSGGYTYSWSPSGGSGSTASNLTANSYTVTVTDSNGCTTTASATITEPTALVASASSSPALCNGGATGSATVTVSGGTSGYSYSWAPSGGTGATATGLTATIYTVTVTDANSCTITATTSVTQPTALAITGSQVDELCNGGNTATASVTVTGGTTAYTYSWSPAPGGGQGTANATGLTAQSYTCNVTDANGCTIQQTFTITEPAALSLSTSTTPSTCGNANGSATVTITGGTPNYSPVWSTAPVQNGNSATNLLAGSYTVTVTDQNGCSATAVAVINNMGSPTATMSASTNVTCFGACDGTATITGNGGTAPYTYSWSPSPGAGQGTPAATNLCPGTYTCTITDANGCTALDSATITQPPQLTISGTTSPVDCFGNATGSASVTVAGGTGAYTYSWSPSGGNAATASNLTAQTYTCTVSDSNSCTITQTLTVTEPPQLTVAIAGFNVTCYNACDGQVVVIPGGGTPNYTFAWSTGCNTAACNNICAGSYTCTVTDFNGCVATANTSVTQPTDISITTSAIDAHCNQADGSATASATGGTGTISYSWLPSGSGPNLNNVAAGTYSVIATDQNGCDDTVAVAVNNLNGVNASLTSVTNNTCFQSCDGAIVTGATGGNGPYVYAWTPSGGSNANASSLCAGSYTLTVSDANGCTSTVSATVTQPTAVTVTASATPAAVCAGTNIQLSASGSGGTGAISYSWNPLGPGQTQNVTPQTSTTYTVTATDGNGCADSTTVAVTINPVPVAALSADVTSGCAPLCVTFSDLSTVAAPGVITSWSWDFGDGNTSTSQNPAHCYNTPGNYTVILNITTADGCTSTITMPAYISVYAMPVAAFGATPQPTTIINPVITFTDSSSNASSWLWSFGDVPNSTSTQQNPTFEYPDAICYQVILEVTSPDGCTDTAMQNVCIGPDASIFVPNAFTPNDDGTNDIFMPVGIGIDPEHFEMWIFDRWGNLIYYTDDLNKGWNGKVQGHEDVCQIDTYVWKIRAMDILGKNHNIEGKVSLIK